MCSQLNSEYEVWTEDGITEQRTLRLFDPSFTEFSVKIEKEDNYKLLLQMINIFIC